MFLYLVLIVTLVSAELDPKNRPIMSNWTTCQEYVKNTTLDLDKIVDIDWRTFYMWDESDDNRHYHLRFSRPSVGLIDRFRVELAKEIKNVKWNQSELFMETDMDLSVLFIRTNVTAIYQFIPSIAFNIPNFPYMEMAIKWVEPGYLGIMSCLHRISFALAPVDKMPHDDHLIEAASRFKFYNGMGHSYLTRSTPPPRGTYDEDDIEEDEMELDQHLNSLHS